VAFPLLQEFKKRKKTWALDGGEFDRTWKSSQEPRGITLWGGDGRGGNKIQVSKGRKRQLDRGIEVEEKLKP